MPDPGPPHMPGVVACHAPSDAAAPYVAPLEDLAPLYSSWASQFELRSTALPSCSSKVASSPSSTATSPPSLTPVVLHATVPTAVVPSAARKLALNESLSCVPSAGPNSARSATSHAPAPRQNNVCDDSAESDALAARDRENGSRRSGSSSAPPSDTKLGAKPSADAAESTVHPPPSVSMSHHASMVTPVDDVSW